MGSADAISQTMQIIQHGYTEGVAAIVSAMSGVTNLLQEGIQCAEAGDIPGYQQVTEKLRQRHQTTAEELLSDSRDDIIAEVNTLIDGYVRFCESVHVLGEATPRALDYTMGLGERMSARIIAAALRERDTPAQAVDATELIVTDNHFQNATPILDATCNQIENVLGPLLEGGITPIITGFIGATEDGVCTTLGRGGSDYSAALIGACLKSDEVWIWTDVDGVMSADPRVVPDARTVDILTYKEVGELAFYGAKVLHPKTIRPVLEADIPLRVKNTFNPEHNGTLIVASSEGLPKSIKAVTSIGEVSLLTVQEMGMLGVPGIAARTFSTVARVGASVLLISQSSSEQNICFMIPDGQSKMVADALNEEFKREIDRRDIDRVNEQDQVTIITVVGTAIRDMPGIAGKIFMATGKAEVNVIAITQGSSECGISLVVAEDQAEIALKAIHDLAIGEGS